MLLVHLIAFVIATTSTLSNIVDAQTVLGPFPDGVPGSGYGCDNSCNTGDVNYVLKAQLQTYKIKGTSASKLTNITGEDYSVFTRTFVGDAAASTSEFCMGGGDGSDGLLGPCLTANPGQKMMIKIINEMDGGQELLKQSRISLFDYYGLATNPGVVGFPFAGSAPPKATDYDVSDPENLPGWEVSFDDVNLHFHGLHVVPHLFYPQGTGNPLADWITVTPQNEDPDQQCFCYVLDLPTDHPQGDYWYHIHRHGSSAIQGWQGMVGFILVGDATSEGSPEKELIEQGITRSETLAFVELRFTNNSEILAPESPNTYIVSQFGNFSIGRTFEYLVNNVYSETFDACVGETIHFHLLNAQVNYGAAVYVFDENDNIMPFYIFSSDGMSYAKPVKKEAIVMAMGNRDSMLVQFNQTGTFRIIRTAIAPATGGDQVFTVAATITVTDVGCTGDNAVLSGLKFTQGVPDISEKEIEQTITVTFQNHFMRNNAPFIEFTINNEGYKHTVTDFNLPVGTAQQWILQSAADEYHPFHIHVNPFQIISIGVPIEHMAGALTTGSVTPTVTGMLANTNISIVDTVRIIDPVPLHRDTVFIPPFGTAVLFQRFGGKTGDQYTGKTVFHCHNLEHEDEGMMSNILIADPTETICAEKDFECDDNGVSCCSSKNKCADLGGVTGICVKCAAKNKKCTVDDDCCNSKATCVGKKCSK